MFCNINTREIEINISKTNTWKNDVLLQYSYSILQLYDNSFQMEWSTKFVIYQSFFYQLFYEQFYEFSNK